MKKKIALICLLTIFSSSAWAQTSQQMMGVSFAPLVEKLLPAVVNISTLHQQQTAPQDEVTSPNSILREYFQNTEEGKTSLGSGFLIDSKGYIVTNEHVIANADKIIVKLNDDNEYTAKIVGKDEMTDIALIKIDAKTALPFVKIGNSDTLKVGDWILAIGNPFGLGGSVSAGIVSAKSRDIDAGSYDDFIQTDASINRGSSGGPLFNMNGEVVGINTALFSSTGNSVGVGFATPANLSKFVIEQLMTAGEVKRGWVGIKISNNTKELNISDNEIIKNGVMVNSLNDNSPAASSGIQTGDIIIAFNGSEVKDVKTFSRDIAEAKISDEVILRIWRNHQIKDITVKIEEMPIKGTQTPSYTPKKQISEGLIKELGMVVDDSSKQVVVKEIKGNSEAHIKGITSGDIIQKINSKPITTIDDINSYIAISRQKNISQIEMQIMRDNTEQILSLEIQSDE